VQGTNLPNSVHLTDWPSVSKPDKASQKLLEEMKKARSFIVEGLAQRAAAGIKVRQPLSSVTIPKVPEELKQIIADELNIKKVIVSSGEGGNTINLDINVSSELKEEGTARELVRVVQNARKSAGFNVDDRIKLRIISSSNEITKAYDKFKELISAETLAEGILEANSQAEYSTSVKVEGCETGIYLSRAH
jgi:isoleucyl-tRNA synthetase